MMSRVTYFLLSVGLLWTMSATAVPIKPDLQKIFKQQENRPKYFEPARAGWNGPEMKRPQDTSPNPVLEAYGPKATERAVRASLLAAAIPDPKAVVAIAAIIMLMRVLRTLEERRKRDVPVLVAAQAPEPERRAA